MDVDDYFAPPINDAELEKVAAEWRVPLKGLFVVKNLDIFALIRTVNALLKRQTEVVVQPDDKMGRANAYVSRDRRKLFVRQSLIDAARQGDPKAIFDAVHELAHLVLHPEGAPLARMIDGNKIQKHIPELNSAERQANYFARAFLMSLEEIDLFPFEDTLATECHVPPNHAKLRLEEAARLPKSVRPRSLRQDFLKPSAAFHRASSHQSGIKSVLPPEIAKMVAWETAPVAEGLDPKEFRRIDERWTIRLSRFGMDSAGGWTVENGSATPWEREQ